MDGVEHIFRDIIDITDDVTIGLTMNISFKEGPVINQCFQLR